MRTREAKNILICILKKMNLLCGRYLARPGCAN
jgi:hypothetical protein